jgi:hypothetical protein
MPDEYQRFAAKMGDRPPMVYTFHDWVSDENWAASNPHLRTFADPLELSSLSPLQLAERLTENGTVLALAWAIQCCDWGSLGFWFGLRKTAVSIPRVLRGDFDRYIREVAGQIKAFGRPIMLTLFSEFNYQGMFAFGEDGSEQITDVDHLCRHYGDPGWPDGPERVRDVFIHVIDLFRQEGVRNVTWFMYAGSHYMNPSHEDYSPWLHPKYFYPGDDYIDWVGQSVYFVDPEHRVELKEEGFNTPATVALQPGYDAWGTVTQRPLFLPEFGPLGDGSVSRARILREVLATYLPSLPRVKALTLGDAEVFEACCQLPRFGRFADEVQVWKEKVLNNPHYVRSVRVGGASP